MSVFDPFSLYVHRQVNTKRGQVIQKKPYLNENQAISPEQVKQAEKILDNLGYIIYPPHTPPVQPVLNMANLSFQVDTNFPNPTTIVTLTVRNFLRTIYSLYQNDPIFNLDYQPTNLYMALNISSMRILVNSSIFEPNTSSVNVSINFGEGNFQGTRYYKTYSSNDNDTICFGRNNAACVMKGTYWGNYTSSSPGNFTYVGTQSSPRGELSSVYSRTVDTYIGIKTNNWQNSDIGENTLLYASQLTSTGSASGTISSITLCGNLFLVLGRGF